MPFPVQPVTFYVPSSATEPIEVRVSHSGLRMMLVNRESVGLLDDSWAVLGVYFLLGPFEDDPGRYRAYVGEVGKRTLLLRVKEHVGSVKDLIDARLLKVGTMLVPLRKGLTQTALVQPDGSLKIGEQAFAAVSPAATAVSGNRSEPGWAFWGAPSGEGGYVPLSTLRDRVREDDGKATHGGGSAPAFAPVALAPTGSVPLAFGVGTLEHAAPAAAPSMQPPGARKRRQFRETVADLLDAGLLHPGVELRPVRKALSDARAMLGPGGRLDVNGEVHGSLSAAAVAVSGNKSEPSWEFWAVTRDGKLVSLHELREELRARNVEAEIHHVTR